MKKVNETPLFIMESEKLMFSQRHPEYKFYVKVYYKDDILAGYLAYKNEPQN